MTWIKLAHYSAWNEDELPELAFVRGCGPERALAWLHLESGAALVVLMDAPITGQLLAFHRDPSGRVHNLTNFLRAQDGGSPFYGSAEEGQKRLQDWASVVDHMLGTTNRAE